MLELPGLTLENAGPILLFLVLCFPALAYQCFAMYTATAFFARPIAVNPYYAPPVTILKPICGLDIDTYQNFASTVCQDYPVYQVIFSVREAADPVIKVVQQIIHDFPQVDIQLVVNDGILGSNLKVGNLANAKAFAKHDILVLADSDVRVRPDYLRRIVQPLQNPEVGATTCLYRPVTQGWIAKLEALSISTHYLANVIVANQIETIQFALGPTIAIRRTVLEKFGDFAAISEYLADDFQIGYLCAQSGYQVVLSDYVIDHWISTASLTDLFRRQVRWACCTRVSRFWGYVGLFFSQGICTSFIFFCLTGGSALGWIGLGATTVTRLMMAWVVGAVGLKDTLVKQYWWLIPLCDLNSFVIWLYSFTTSRIVWRGQNMILTRGGKLVLEGYQK